MKRVLCGVAALGVMAAIASPAFAHVTVQPNEATTGSFSRFVVRVPTERDVPTTKIEVELPPLGFVSFEPKEGWTREEEMVELDEPIEVFGNEVTEVVGSVTWSGGKVAPGEFDEFGISFATPADEQTLEFKAFQTYQGGEVVEWTGAPDSEEPAARVNLYDIGAGEGEGQLAVLNRLADQSAQSGDGAPEDEQDDDGGNTGMLGVVLGGAGLVLGLIAISIALKKS